MEDIYYIHDPATNVLIVRRFHEATAKTIERRVKQEAEHHGMDFQDCDWGGVSELKIDIA